MRISDWSSDVCSSDLSRVPDCSQAADPTPSIASGSCLESSQLHFSGSLPGFRHFQQAGPASTVSGDRITFLLTKIAIEQADFIDLPFLLCFGDAPAGLGAGFQAELRAPI